MKCIFPDDAPPCARCAKKSSTCVIPKGRSRKYTNSAGQLLPDESLPASNAEIDLESSNHPCSSNDPQPTPKPFPAAVSKSPPPISGATLPLVTPNVESSVHFSAPPPKRVGFTPPFDQSAVNLAPHATIIDPGNTGVPVQPQYISKLRIPPTRGLRPVPLHREVPPARIVPGVRFVLYYFSYYRLNFFNRAHKHLLGVANAIKSSKGAGLHHPAARGTKGRNYDGEDDKYGSDSEYSDEDSSASEDQHEGSENGEDSEVEDFKKVLEAIEVENEDSKSANDKVKQI
jgi:hypothetical protein